MNDKIIDGNTLEYTLSRLACCAAVFNVLQKDIANGENCTNALAGACDHLESIIGDFRVDILASPDYEDGEDEEDEPFTSIPPDGTGNVWGSQRVSDEDGSGPEEIPVRTKDVLTLWDGWDSPDIFEVREVSSKGRCIARHEITGEQLMESHFSESSLKRFGSCEKGADGTWRHYVEIAVDDEDGSEGADRD